MKIIGRKSNYIEDPKIANEIDDEEASTNEASNQKDQRPFDQKEIPNERKDIMIRANGCSI